MKRGIISTGVKGGFALAFLFVVADVTPKLEARRGKPAAEVPVVLTFGTASTDALQSDGFVAPGYSADYAHGVENVQAVLYPAGNLGFSTQADTRSPALRSVCITFGGQLVPFAARQCVSMSQPMHEYTTDITSIQNLAYGQSVTKLTRFAWTDAATNTIYRLGYGTDMDANGQLDAPPVRATCIAPTNAGAGACTTWTITPEPGATAALFSFAQTIRGGKITVGPPVLVGRYTMPFVETISRK